MGCRCDLEQPYPGEAIGDPGLIEDGGGQTEAEKDAAFLASLKTGWLKEDEGP